VKVQCEKKRHDCPDSCVHKAPHEPVYDRYDDSEGNYKDGYCNDVIGMCWYKYEQQECRCMVVPEI